MSTSHDSRLGRTQVALAGDHEMLGEALAGFLAASGDVRVVATLRVDDGLSESVARVRPDVVVLDLGDGRTRVGGLVRAIRGTVTPPPAVVVVSGSRDGALAVEAARAGADAWVAKTSSLEDLIGAIRAVRDEHGRYPDEQLGAILRALRETADGRSVHGLPVDVSPREIDVLRYLLAGRRDGEIAAATALSVHTVRTHVRNLLRKLGVHSRVDAARLAAEAGLEPHADAPRAPTN